MFTSAQLWRFWLVLVLFFGLNLAALPAGNISAASKSAIAQPRVQTSPATVSMTVLYDAALGDPASQGLAYGAYRDQNPFNQTVSATETYSPSAQLVIIDSSQVYDDHAGNGACKAAPGVTCIQPNSKMPVLDRQTGFRYDFRVKVDSESHLTNDRAGYSVIAISQDLQGIELGFWQDQIWAQAVGFTHAEGVSYNTTAALTAYQLYVLGDRYFLYTSGTLLLSGPLRNYSTDPNYNVPPYTVPNFIFLGDDTTGAAAKVEFSYVGLQTNSSQLLVTSAADDPASTTVTVPVTLRQAAQEASIFTSTIGATIYFALTPVVTGPITLTAPLTLPAKTTLQGSCASPVSLKVSATAPLNLGSSDVLQGLSILAAPGSGPALRPTGTGTKFICTKISAAG